MRVLMANWLYKPEFSGAALQSHRLSRKLMQLGVDVEVLSGTDQMDLVGASDVDGIPIFRVLRNKMTIHSHARYGIDMLQYILKHQKRFDLLHAHGFLAPVGVASKITGLPLVQKITNLYVDDPLAVRKRQIGYLLMSIYKSAWVVVATSKLLADICHFSLPIKRKMVRIPNGVDTDIFKPANLAEKRALRRKLGIPEEKSVLLSVGTISYTKGIDMLLKAMNYLRKYLHEEPILLLVGPSEYNLGYRATDPEVNRFAEQMHNMVVDYGLQNRVRFEGIQKNVDEYMKISDIYIHPSRREGQPNALLEAMASGLPSVANLIEGITDEVIQGGKFGYTIDCEETEEFAAGINVLLKNHRLRCMLGERSRAEVIKKYNMNLIAKKYIELYERLLRRKKT